MTSKELRDALAELPDDMPVFYEEVGTDWTPVEVVAQGERDMTPFDEPSFISAVVLTTKNSRLARGRVEG